MRFGAFFSFFFLYMWEKRSAARPRIANKFKYFVVSRAAPAKTMTSLEVAILYSTGNHGQGFICTNFILKRQVVIQAIRRYLPNHRQVQGHPSLATAKTADRIQIGMRASPFGP